MAYDFNGTSQYLNTASSPITNGPLTMACLFRLDAAVGTISLVTLNDANGQERFSLSSNPSVNRAVQFAFVTSGGSILGLSENTPSASANTWHHAVATVSGTGSGTVFTTYFNGQAGTSATDTLSPVGNIDSIIVGARYGASVGLFLDGQIAEVGIWNAALTAAEVASLAKGMTCDKVRGQSLVFYAPLIRSLQDLRGGLSITNNNTATVANHPRVYA
jgi:hypothetical protein